MKATIISIEKSDRFYVTVVLRNKTYGLDLYHHPKLIHCLETGQKIPVRYQTNNPFLIPID